MSWNNELVVLAWLLVLSTYLKLLEINKHFDKSILKSPHIYISLFKNFEYIL